MQRFRSSQFCLPVVFTAALIYGCSDSSSLVTRLVAATTIAGSSTAGAVDGASAVARFANPVNVAVDPQNTTYVADFDNGRVRRIDAQGNVTTIVQQANFNTPFGICLTKSGVLYLETDGNDLGARDATTGTIWKVDLAAKKATVVVRNTGRPRGLLALDDGRLVLSDLDHHTLRVLNPTSGQITLLAGKNDSPGLANGTGAAARFSRPYGVARATNGDLLVADTNNHSIRRVTLAGVVTTVAGTGVAGYLDGSSSVARFNTPQAVATDAAGSIYVSDNGNHRIRKIDKVGNVSTIAGDGKAGFKDGQGVACEFFGQEGMAITPDGSALIVADGTGGDDVPYNRIRRVTVP